MRRLVILLLTITFLVVPSVTNAYQPIDLNNSPCDFSILGCIPGDNAVNPIREMAEKNIRSYLPNLTYKDNPVIDKFNYFIEPGLDPLYKEYAKAAIGVSYEFWGKNIANPSSIIISTKSEFYKNSLCGTYYQVDKASYEKCKSSPLSNFGDWWPENDNPNSFGAVFNYITEVDPKGKLRVDYPAIFIFISEEQKNKRVPQRDLLRTIIHEVTHLSQWGLQGDNNPQKIDQNRFSANSPLLFTEGSAQYLGTALAHIYFNSAYNLSFPSNAKWVGESFNPDIYSLINQNRSESYKNNNLANLYYSGGLMTELYIAHFGVKSFIELNRCLTPSSENVERTFERCFTSTTGASFREWTGLASRYVDNIFNAREIKLEDYNLLSISKAPAFDTYQLELATPRSGEIVLKINIKDFGVKRASALDLVNASGKIFCQPLKSNMFCAINNDELTGERVLYLLAEDGGKSEITVPSLMEALPAVKNLTGEVDSSSNYNQATSGLDNSLVRISWNEAGLESSNGGTNTAGDANGQNQSNPNTGNNQSSGDQNANSGSGGSYESGSSNSNNSSTTNTPSSNPTQPVGTVAKQSKSYQVSLSGCLNEKGEVSVKDVTVNSLTAQIPCLTAFTKMTDNLKVGVREVSTEGVGKWSNIVINPNSEKDLLPVSAGITIIKNKDETLTLKYKKNTKRDLEIKAQITKISKGRVILSSLIFLDSNKEKYLLSDMLNNQSGEYRIEILIRAKGESNFDYGVSFKSKPITITYKAKPLPKNQTSKFSGSEPIPTPTPTVKPEQPKIIVSNSPKTTSITKPSKKPVIPKK